jgi:DNA-binding transcriptional LysR family regulator
VRVALHTVVNHEVVHMIAENRAELGLVLTPAEDSATLSTELCAGNLVCIVPKQHPLARRRTLGAADLLEWPLISFSASLPIGALIDRAFEREGLRRSFAIEVTQSASAYALVRAGAGVAVLDSFALSDGVGPGVMTIPFAPSIPIQAKLLSGRHRPLSRLAQSFAEILQDVVADEIAAGRLHGTAANLGTDPPRARLRKPAQAG